MSDRHDSEEEKPCYECRVKLILAGVEPKALEGISTMTMARDILAEKLHETTLNKIIVESLDKKPQGLRCRGLCTPAKNKASPSYNLESYCKRCDAVWSKCTRCVCCGGKVRNNRR